MIQRLLFICLGLLATCSAGARTYSVLQGATSDKVAHFTVVSYFADPLKFQARNSNRTFEPSQIQRVEYEGSDWVVYRVKFEDLSGHDFELQIDSEATGDSDVREFQTFDLNAERGRIAFVSCMLRQFHNPFLWANLEKPEYRPDALFILGDAVYLDRSRLLFSRNPDSGLKAWEDFVKARETIAFYKWKRLVPIFSVPDDHDSGGDNVDALSSLMIEVHKVYSTFFANEEIPGFSQRGPGLSQALSLFHKNFILIDGRSYRDIDANSPWIGKSQEDWVIERIRSGENYLLSGSQFFGEFLKKDSLTFNWPNYATSFFERLRQRELENHGRVAFASGDIHFSELQEIESRHLGYPTVEITSSSAHSFGFAGFHRFKPFNPRQRAAAGTHNFVLMDIEGLGQPVDVRSVSWRGQTLFRSRVKIGEPLPHCESEMLGEIDGLKL